MNKFSNKIRKIFKNLPKMDKFLKKIFGQIFKKNIWTNFQKKYLDKFPKKYIDK